ncbi:Dihydrolipoyl dehydrogenase [bioreactor metagenome]|uniref:Dihydrolipoyl dehydrogenase n=1 Tax=bioreactor metagenome TaxID=1076179 RepID=A0A644WEL2_9ZZZZ
MEYDVLIIGAGPAGYVAAIRAGQVGLKTVVVEKKYIGGMCLNWGCIPTKALLESARMYDKMKSAHEFGIDGIDLMKLSFNWEKAKMRSNSITKKLTSGVKYLLKKNGVELITGTARIIGDNEVLVDDKKITAANIIIATGSKPKAMNVQLADAPVIDMENLFSLETIADNIVVTGNHVSAVEISQFFRLIGKNVTLVSNSNTFMHGFDDYLVSFISKKLQTQNIELILNAYPEKFENGELIINDKKIKCDLLVNCNSRKAIIPESDMTLELNERGFIKTSDNFETNLKGVYAIGDVSGRSFVAHVASAQGIHVINSIKGIKADFNSRPYPINMYTSPEMAQIGMTEKQLKEEGLEYKISEFPLSANGKAMIEDNTEGFIRMLSDKKYGQVLGVQIVAANATDMIAEAAAYMDIEGTVYDVANTIHAHPTVSEIFMEAGFDAVDKAIHK